MAGDKSSGQTLGADVRALRKSRGMTLVDLADAMGRSVGWLSQVERDISSASVDELGRFAELFDVPVSRLLLTSTKDGERGKVVRSRTRRPIGSRKPGMHETLISPDLTDSFEVLSCVFEPFSALAEPLSRPTQEIGHVIRGRFNIWIDGEPFELDTGDSFRLRGQMFQWANPFDETCEVIWVISPPVY
jgi:transcriptional regulator with XRE-family HTH domain